MSKPLKTLLAAAIMLFTAVAAAFACSPSESQANVPAEKGQGTENPAQGEGTGTEDPAPGENEGQEEINPMMYIDWVGFSKGSIKVGKDFRSETIKIFASRDWTVEYNRDLLVIEPENGPGQVDSQLVKISLKEGIDWETDILDAKGYIPDAVFTAGKKVRNLAFITSIPDYPLPKDGDILTIVEYNIERGMAADKADKFDNFVKWVKEQDPDILLLCECNEFNDEKMRRLAARWGHPYAAVTVDDGWNPAITSKYPLENLVKYTKGFSHGALSAKILGINFICIHSCASWFDTNDWYGGEAKDYDGNGSINSFDYRISELHCLFDSTIFKYPGEKYWLLTGDLNAVSPTEKRWENWHEGYYVEHNYILSLDFWTDIMREQHPDDPMFTYARNHVWDEEAMQKTEDNPQQMSYERLDYFYISDALVPLAGESGVVSDDFTTTKSDHRPIRMTLTYKKQ